MKRHRYLVIPDGHVGSVWGLSPKEFIGDKKVVKANDIQRHLLKSWNHMKGKTARRKIDTVIFLGDEVEGPGYRKRGRELMSTDTGDQVINAADLFLDLLKTIKPKNAFVFSGTDYHSSAQQDNERDLALQLGATYLGLGPHSLDFGDVPIIFLHGSGSVYWYRGTKMDKIDFARKLNMAESNLYDSIYVVQGHLHFQGLLSYRYGSVYMVPCWQAQTDYMRKKDPFKHVPDIGCLELEVKNGKLSHRFYEYPHPPRPKTHIAGVAIHPKEAKKTQKLSKW